jgi:hypothetical protein
MMGLSMPFVIDTSYSDSLDAMKAVLPVHMQGWTAEEEDRFFDDMTIFKYINGGGELYRAYNMRRCLSRRYAKPAEPLIVLDIFDMGSSEDAFGIFTHDQDGKALEIGQGSLYHGGWLRFWKNRYFVSIYSEGESTVSKHAVEGLGKAVAALIRGQGQRPGILCQLPSKGLQNRGIRYFHHHFVLNHHFYLANQNILNLGPETDAVLADYDVGNGIARLLLILYPGEGEAAAGYAGFMRHYLPENETMCPALLENGKWSGAEFKGNLLSIVLDAHSRKFAEELLDNTMKTPSRN